MRIDQIRPPFQKEYASLIERFCTICDDLTKSGSAYFTVVLCHELYRFMYPTEPYAKFENQQPVDHSISLIKKLIALGEGFQKSIVPYAFSVEQFRVDPTQVLEKDTSDLYSSLWKDFDLDTLTKESSVLVKHRIPDHLISQWIKGKKVLDMGCGSGRYSIALALLGAREVTGVDVQAKAFKASEEWCQKNKVQVNFLESNVHKLPFEDQSFDFVFCNGVLHHTSSIEAGLLEYDRVMKKGGAGFIYLYGSGGIFWNTRRMLRKVFKNIPVDYTKSVLRTIGMPSNRFIFCDTWYVPTEMQITKEEMEGMLDHHHFKYEKLIPTQPFDIDRALVEDAVQGTEMYGCGDHRYFVWKP